MESGYSSCILKVADKNVAVPLTSVDVSLTIKGFIANVESTLHFKNTESNSIEAVYEFPIDDQSAVYHFEARIEDRVIVAECQEKKQAKETYDDAIRTGHTATLLEEDASSSDIFRCLLGNLPAGTEAIVKFAYVIELPLLTDGSVQFTLPTQLNPRYNPSLEKGGTTQPVNVPYVMPGGNQPYAFAFRANVHHTSRIGSIKSEKDELSVVMSDDGKHAEVSLVKSFTADHDLSLQVTYQEATVPHVVVEKGDAQKAGILHQDVVMLNFFPELSDSEFSNKHEFIFVIDRSGSMDGPRIRSAQTALLVFLKSLPPGCFFNIIGFGSSFELLFPDGSREYSEDSLNAACTYQSRLNADMGGTEILQPLEAIYNKPPMTTHSRQILLLTDGEVSNTYQVIELVRTNTNSARVFTFGIGEGASTTLVKGVAKAGRGKAEFVTNNDQITGQVMKILKCAMQVSVTDLALEWNLGGSAKLVQVPRELPPLFSGDRLIVYAVNNSDQAVLEGQVHLKGKVGQRSVDFVINVSSSDSSVPFDSALSIHRLAAKAEIKQLQVADKDDANKAAIVQLSVAANIVSKHTSMVGVDLKRKATVADNMISRQIPLMMSPDSAYVPRMMCAAAPCGFSLGAFPVAACAAPPTAMKLRSARVMRCAVNYDVAAPSDSLPAPPQPQVAGLSCGAACEDSDADIAFMCGRDDDEYDLDYMECSDDSYAEMCDDVGGVLYDDCAGPLRAPPKKILTSGASSYVSVVSLQTFSGSWKFDDSLVSLLEGIDKERLMDASPVKSLDVWATAIALALLQHKFGGKKDEWEMIDMKARQWLSGQSLDGHSVDALVDIAVKLLSAAA